MIKGYFRWSPPATTIASNRSDPAFRRRQPIFCHHALVTNSPADGAPSICAAIFIKKTCGCFSRNTRARIPPIPIFCVTVTYVSKTLGGARLSGRTTASGGARSECLSGQDRIWRETSIPVRLFIDRRNLVGAKWPESLSPHWPISSNTWGKFPQIPGRRQAMRRPVVSSRTVLDPALAGFFPNGELGRRIKL